MIERIQCDCGKVHEIHRPDSFPTPEDLQVWMIYHGNNADGRHLTQEQVAKQFNLSRDQVQRKSKKVNDFFARENKK